MDRNDVTPRPHPPTHSPPLPKKCPHFSNNEGAVYEM